MTQLKELSGDLTFLIPVAGQSTAGNADEWSGFIAPFDVEVTDVTWIPNAAITADATNYFSLVVKNRGAGAGSTAIATRAYSATNGVAFAPEPVTLSSTDEDRHVDAGDLVTVAKTNAGTGLAMPDGLVQVTVRAR